MKSVNQFTCKVLVHVYACDKSKGIHRNEILASPPVPFGANRLHLDLAKNARLCYCSAPLSVTHADPSTIIRLCIIPSFSSPATHFHFPANRLLVPRELSTCLDLRRDQRWPGPPTRSLPPTHAPPSQHANARHAYALYPLDSSIAPPSANTMPQSHSNKVASPQPSRPQSTCSQMAPCHLRRVQWALIP
jgi:hypothetical protein